MNTCNVAVIQHRENMEKTVL